MAVLIVTSYNFYELSSHVVPQGTPPGAGTLGGANIRAGLLTMIFGERFDYSSPAYQLKSSYIDFEKNNGEVVHMHAANVTLGFLFKTMNIGLTDKCFTFPDKRNYCTDNQYSLKFFINHHQVQDITNYVIKNYDWVLISYGYEKASLIAKQLAIADSFILTS